MSLRTASCRISMVSVGGFLSMPGDIDLPKTKYALERDNHLYGKQAINQSCFTVLARQQRRW
jgi:hypothetical protein